MKSLLFVRLYSLLQREDSSGRVLPVQVTDMELGAAGPVLGYPNRKQGECDSPGTVQGLEKGTRQSNRCPTILPTLQTGIFQLQNKIFWIKNAASIKHVSSNSDTWWPVHLWFSLSGRQHLM